MAGWRSPLGGAFVCSLLAVALQVRPVPLCPLAPHAAPQTAAASSGPLVPICVRLRCCCAWLWLVGGPLRGAFVCSLLAVALQVRPVPLCLLAPCRALETRPIAPPFLLPPPPSLSLYRRALLAPPTLATFSVLLPFAVGRARLIVMQAMSIVGSVFVVPLESSVERLF